MAKRPFRGLRTVGPRESYDVAVIGAGIAGLTLAALLARRGFSVLLVEQHYMVGGYCSTFRRGGFTFDAATHFYPLLGNPQALTAKLLASIGATTRWVRMDPVDTFHLPDGSKFEVPADYDTYRARLAERFPAERENLDAYFAEAQELYLLGSLEYLKGKPTPRLDRWRNESLRQALDRHFRDPALKLILTADCPHWGGPPERTSFVFDSMGRLSYFLGNYYPEGGSQAFADDLGRCVEEAGGDLLMSTAVDRIVVENGRAVGLDLTTTRGALVGRHSVRARAIVSNADLRQTIERLLPSEATPEALREQVREMRPSFPCYLAHIGLSEAVTTAQLEEAKGYHWQGWNPDEMGRGSLRCKIFVPTLFEPRMAPPGKHVVIQQKVIEVDYDAITDWAAHKAEVQEYLLTQLERAIPGVREHIEVVTVATAATSQRFTWNTEGAMLGWEMSPGQLGAGRPGIVGPVENLWLVGHWVQPGGGITPVLISAQQGAEAVAAALG
jgi:phytoene desaturase